MNDIDGNERDLDALRRALFPALPRDEGRRRLDEALAHPRDDEWWARVEREARQGDPDARLMVDLLYARVRQQR